MELRDSQGLERLTLDIEPTTSSTTVAMTPVGFTLRDQTEGIAAGWCFTAAALELLLVLLLCPLLWHP